MNDNNTMYTYSICYKCDGRGYLKDQENKTTQCDICKGKGETKDISDDICRLEK